MIISETYPDNNKSNCVWRIINDKCVIFSDGGEWLHELNDVGIEIWKMCDGNSSVSDIINKICDEFNVERDVADADVSEFINELSKKDLISLNKKD